MNATLVSMIDQAIARLEREVLCKGAYGNFLGEDGPVCALGAMYYGSRKVTGTADDWTLDDEYKVDGRSPAVVLADNLMAVLPPKLAERVLTKSRDLNPMVPDINDTPGVGKTHVVKALRRMRASLV